MTETGEQGRAALWQGIALGLLAAAFFSVSFVLNRQIAQASGHWAWSSSLRFMMMLPPLLAVITVRRQWRDFLELWRLSPAGWIVWGTLVSAVFYAALTAACVVSPAWVVAATWPVAIVIGILLGPILYRGGRRRIPRRALLFSLIILLGIGLLQVGQFRTGLPQNVTLGLALVLLSATAHPLGNRKSMMIVERSGRKTNAILRLTLLIVGSLPAILLLCLWGWVQAGPPPTEQLMNVGIIALAGLVATPLFYAATDRVSHDPAALAAVESTQAGEIVFTLILEAILLGIQFPGIWGQLGLAFILSGILMHARPKKRAA